MEKSKLTFEDYQAILLKHNPDFRFHRGSHAWLVKGINEIVEKEIDNLKEQISDLKIKCSTDPELLKAEYNLALAIDVKVSEQSHRIQQQDSELKKLHKEFTDQAIKIEEKNVKIQQLEGLLKRRLEWCIAQKADSEKYNDWLQPEVLLQMEIDSIEALLKSST